jgi:hypothetical protein
MAARGITSTPLAPPPDGYRVDRYQVGVDGRLLALFSALDNESAIAKGLLAVAVGAGWRPLASFPFAVHDTAFDATPDGCCVIARLGRRSGEANTSVYFDGAKVGAFHAGDFVLHLQCDGRGGIWIGYHDQAFGISDLSGIVRFSVSGEILSRSADLVVDCYALNVGRDATWSCWYSGFPLVRLDDNCSGQQWTNALASGVSAVAVSPPYALLVGCYDDCNRLTLAEMVRDGLKLVHVFDAKSVLGVDLAEAWFTARNDCLFVVGGGRAYTVPVSHFVGAEFR